ncbi:MAG: dynamin family protein [Myxococcota bacterium]
MRHPILAEAIALINDALQSQLYPAETNHILLNRKKQLERRTQDDRIFVAFIGEKKAGKTALVRALTQVPLPTAVRECTAAVCEIQVGNALHHHAHFSDGKDQRFEAIDDTQHRQKLQSQQSKDTEAAKASAKQIIDAERKKKDTEIKMSAQKKDLIELEKNIGTNQRELRSAQGSQPWMLPWMRPFKWLSSNISERLNTIERIESELNEAQQTHAQQKEQLAELLGLHDAQEEELKDKWDFARNQAIKYGKAIQDTEMEIEHIQKENTKRFAGDLSLLIDVQKNPAERIQIQSPNLDIPDNLVILDTPGLNTDRPDHRRRAWSAIEELADVCILVSDLRQPMPDTLMDMLDRLIPYCPNLHVALTKRDLARNDAVGLSDSPDTEVAEAIIMAKARIADRWPHPLQVWSVASINPTDQEDVRTKFKVFWEKLSPELRVQKHGLLASAVLAEIADLLTPQIADIQSQLSALKSERRHLETTANQSIVDRFDLTEHPFSPILLRLRSKIREHIRLPEAQWLKNLEAADSIPVIQSSLTAVKTQLDAQIQNLTEWLRGELNVEIQNQASQMWHGDTPLDTTEFGRLHQGLLASQTQSDTAGTDENWPWTSRSDDIAAIIGKRLSDGQARPWLLTVETSEMDKTLDLPLEEAKHKVHMEVEDCFEQLEHYFLGLLADIDETLNAHLISLLKAANRSVLETQFEPMMSPHRAQKKKLMSFQRHLWQVRTRFLQTC